MSSWFVQVTVSPDVDGHRGRARSRSPGWSRPAAAAAIAFGGGAGALRGSRLGSARLGAGAGAGAGTVGARRGLRRGRRGRGHGRRWAPAPWRPALGEDPARSAERGTRQRVGRREQDQVPHGRRTRTPRSTKRFIGTDSSACRLRVLAVVGAVAHSRRRARRAAAGQVFQASRTCRSACRTRTRASSCPEPRAPPARRRRRRARARIARPPRAARPGSRREKRTGTGEARLPPRPPGGLTGQKKPSSRTTRRSRAGGLARATGLVAHE